MLDKGIETKDKNSTDPWLTRPDTIRRFLELRPRYEDFCREVEYILTKRVRQSRIEISTITSRAKTLNSFLEKLERKLYPNPFNEIMLWSREKGHKVKLPEHIFRSRSD